MSQFLKKIKGANMRFRLGYVAMTLNLVDCSPSGTVTVSAFNKLPDDEARMYRLRKLTKKNLDNTLRILKYNEAININVYRFTSKLIPLATHPIIEHWDFVNDFKEEFKEIGDFVKKGNFRVSAHPDHYTLINSESKKVLDGSIRDLEYHVKLYEAMGLDDCKYKLVMHVGGLYKDKEGSMKRFKENFGRLPGKICSRLILENDDKSYSASDVLSISKDLNIPMVLDVHHHNCVNKGEKLETLLPDIFATWNGEKFNPKIHFSSPKSAKNFRSHADDIELDGFLSFINTARSTGRDFDVMLEAKNKDTALINLSERLKDIEGFKRINEGEFEVI